jgi:hypothetical protein
MRAWVAMAVPILILGTLAAQPPTAAFNVAGPVGGPAVQGAPYSAEMVTPYDNVLTGGKRLHGETHGKVYRDSQGRTRTESDAVLPAASEQKSVLIFINDPVQHTMTFLDSRTMTARVNPWNAASGAYSPSLGGPAPLGNPPTPAPGTTAVPTSTVAAATPLGRASAGGALAGATNPEDLGTREMEGVTVRGTRVTRTVDPPAGGAGTSRSIVTTTWISPDLQVAVLTETDDTQSGNRATKLVNIVRTEPDATLFQIPAGYTVADSQPRK